MWQANEIGVHMTDMTQLKPDGTSSSDSLQDAASTLARQAGGEVKAVTQDVRAHGQQLIGTSLEQLRGQAAEQTTRLTDGLNDATQQLRKLAGGDPQPGVVADLVHQLADMTQRAADRMSEGGLDGAMTDLRKMARNQTGLFLLGALGAGMVAGRVLRATDTKSIAQTAKEAFTGEGDDANGASDTDAASSSSTPAMVATTMPGSMAIAGSSPSVAEFGR